jgi:hypothetical protein
MRRYRGLQEEVEREAEELAGNNLKRMRINRITWRTKKS